MSTSKPKSVKTIDDLTPAYEGSYYTLLGAGGDLAEWVDGYEDLLQQAGIGKPSGWLVTTGAAVNAFAMKKKEGALHRDDEFPADLTILMFPLDGLHAGRLPLFKLQYQDRWFDDVIDNMRVVGR